MRFFRDEKETFISTGRAARYLSVHVTTLQRWDREGKLKPRRLPSGHRRYSVAELDEFMRLGLNCDGFLTVEEVEGHRHAGRPREEKAVLYCRFPGLHPGKASKADSRVRSLARKAEAMGLRISRVITEVGSGVDDERRGMNELLDFLSENPGTVVVVRSKNQLATVGWGFLKRFLDALGCRVVETACEQSLTERELLYDDIMNLADRLKTMVSAGPSSEGLMDVDEPLCQDAGGVQSQGTAEAQSLSADEARCLGDTCEARCRETDKNRG